MKSKNKNNTIESQILYHCAALLSPGDLVRSLGRKYPLEEGMVTHSSILTQRSPWSEEPGRLQSMRSQRVGQTEVLLLVI